MMIILHKSIIILYHVVCFIIYALSCFFLHEKVEYDGKWRTFYQTVSPDSNEYLKKSIAAQVCLVAVFPKVFLFR